MIGPSLFTGKRRIVVTGLGVIAPTGKTTDEFWSSIIQGRSGVGYITSFDTKDFRVKIGAPVKDFDPSCYLKPSFYRKMDRFAQLGACATKLALEDAGLVVTDKNRHRIGIIIGSGLGGILFHEEQVIEVIRNGGPSQAEAGSVPRITPNAVSSHIAILFQIKGLNYAISTACSSGANAIGLALILLRSGIIDICIAGGTEAPLTPVTLAAYQAMKCLSTGNENPSKASRPFDKDRDGFVLGEGAGILILESITAAEERGAKIYAELAGYGTTCGAYNMVALQPDGLDAAQAIRLALEDANVLPSHVSYINAHGTATIPNDIVETKAIKEIFGSEAYKIPVSSTKSMIGHTIGASGAIEAAVSILTIHKGLIHPTINLEHQDPECDLDYVPNQYRQREVQVALSNSFGFGSNNACLVFRKYGSSDFPVGK